jgi:hypothetical protein
MTIGGHPDLETDFSLQLRDSVGLTPNFPRFLWQLFPARTDAVISIPCWQKEPGELKTI